MRIPHHIGLLAALAAGSMISCATGSHAVRRSERGYLQLDVEPAHAIVEIDGVYNGEVDGWVQHVVPVEPGTRQVTLRAKGYVTQRFDVKIAAGEEVTLQLSLEPELELKPASVGLAERRPGAQR